MKRKILVLFLLLSLFIQGCCSCEKYKRLLQQHRQNLVDDVRPKYKKGLDLQVKHEGYNKDFAENDLGIVDDMIFGIDRINAATKKGDKKP